MSDGSLSQSEIDALLAGTEELMGSSMGGGSTTAAPSTGESLSDVEKNNLLDVMRNATDAAAQSLGTLISTKVGVGMMKADLMRPEEIRSELGGRLVQVSMNMQGDIGGENTFVLPDSGALVISNMTMGQSGDELTDMALKALTDTMNQMFAAAASSLSARLSKPIQFADAKAVVAHANTELTLPSGGHMLRLSYTLKIEGQNQVQVTQIMSFKLAREIINLAMGIGTDMQFGPAPSGGGGGGGGFAGAAPQDTGPSPGQIGVAPVQYPQLSADMTGAGSQHNISMLMDVQMQLSVELGRTRKKISEILGFGEGSIIELDKLAGEPVDVLVNGKLIAKGEVVVIDENFGVRVTEIVSPNSRLELSGM